MWASNWRVSRLGEGEGEVQSTVDGGVVVVVVVVMATLGKSLKVLSFLLISVLSSTSGKSSLLTAENSNPSGNAGVVGRSSILKRNFKQRVERSWTRPRVWRTWKTRS